MKIIQAAITLTLALALSACGNNDATRGTLTGAVRIDGSSTVFPISEAIAEEYRGVESRVRVTVGVSGTGGGFKKFCAGEIDISDASRVIKSSEMDAARENGIEYIEIPVAFDGLAVVVNPKNTFVNHLTVEELQRIWQPGSTVTTWKDVRPSWPDPTSTTRIEDLMLELKERYTIVIVTHNMQQAARASDYTAFPYEGSLIEFGPTEEVFTRPKRKRTEDYVTGRFG